MSVVSEIALRGSGEDPGSFVAAALSGAGRGSSSSPYHAILSPSGAHRWMACPAAPRMERHIVDTGSDFANEGTSAHFLASWCLTEKHRADVYLGETIVMWSNPQRELHGVCFKKQLQATEATEIVYEIAVGDDMAKHVQCYLNAVLTYAVDGDLLVEQNLPIDHLTGEPKATGTGDAVIFTDGGEEMCLVDLKYGMGEEVSPERNPQLMMYGLGALSIAGLLGHNVKRVRLVIHQPRINQVPSEWTCTVDELLEFGQDVKTAAAHAASIMQLPVDAALEPYCVPGVKQCRWCKAKSICVAAYKKVATEVGAQFEDLDMKEEPKALVEGLKGDELGLKMAVVDFVEKWCTAIRAECERRLLAGTPVAGWKLVQGRRGARSWNVPEEAEAMLKKMRLKQEEMYKFSLFSPTQIEKVLATDHPKQWKKVAELVVQRDGLPSVAPESDKRPALEVKPVADMFQELPAEEALI